MPIIQIMMKCHGEYLRVETRTSNFSDQVTSKLPERASRLIRCPPVRIFKYHREQPCIIFSTPLPWQKRQRAHQSPAQQVTCNRFASFLDPSLCVLGCQGRQGHGGASLKCDLDIGASHCISDQLCLNPNTHSTSQDAHQWNIIFMHVNYSQRRCVARAYLEGTHGFDCDE